MSIKKVIYTIKKRQIFVCDNKRQNVIKKNKIINLKTKSLSIVIQQYHEKNIFDVIEIIIHDVVLKLFWLKKHNLDVNWKNKIFIFKKCQYMIDIVFAYQQNLIINKK